MCGFTRIVAEKPRRMLSHRPERRYVVGAVVIGSDIGENLVELFAPDRGETRLTGQFTRSERGRGHRGFISLVGMILGCAAQPRFDAHQDTMDRAQVTAHVDVSG